MRLSLFVGNYFIWRIQIHKKLQSVMLIEREWSQLGRNSGNAHSLGNKTSWPWGVALSNITRCSLDLENLEGLSSRLYCNLSCICLLTKIYIGRANSGRRRESWQSFSMTNYALFCRNSFFKHILSFQGAFLYCCLGCPSCPAHLDSIG